jgi:hypothetical protein
VSRQIKMMLNDDDDDDLAFRVLHPSKIEVGWVVGGSQVPPDPTCIQVSGVKTPDT